MGTIRSGEREISTEELTLRGARAASALDSLGIGADDGVAIYLRNDLAFFEAAIGASAIGAYPIAVNWHYSADEARYVLEDSGAKAIVIHADLLHRIREAIPDGVKILVVPTPSEIASAYGVDPGLAAVPEGELDWSSWIDGFDPRLGEPAGTTLSIIYTSGTTGHPKGVKRPPFTQEEIERLTGTLAVIFGFDLFEDPSRIVTAAVGPI